MDIEKQQPGVYVSPEPVPIAVSSAVVPEVAPATVHSNLEQGAATDVPMHMQAKLGSKCCGCCCDFRRATLATGMVATFVYTLSLISALTDGNADIDGAEGALDSEEAEIYEDEMRTTSIVLGILGLVFASFGSIRGAMTYNKYLVLADVVFIFCSYVAESIAIGRALNEVEDQTEDDVGGRVGMYIGGLVTTALWIYPKLGFMWEVHTGIMSPQTYAREKYSCCCDRAKGDSPM